ncbi:pyridoxal-dependent decarboxylase C-terminal sheet domain protein [Clostridium sp. CAG:413]|mgnify:FL=1|nr:pyridoxal-dependent decarboxylase C-terminal sheet domain protein [Clostridium sp. CAG:413]
MNSEALQDIAASFATPAFIFDADEFGRRAKNIKSAIGGASLCYSIKANPFLLACLPEEIDRVEVCSPGELAICRRVGVDPSTVVYSGVNKGSEDIAEAIEYGAELLTAESLRQLGLINAAALAAGKRVRVALRLTSGNQFGMDSENLKRAVAEKGSYEGVDIVAIHYYSGTQKKKLAVVEKELAELEKLADTLEERFGLSGISLEYGPGLPADYFGDDPEGRDMAVLAEAGAMIAAVAARRSVTVEFGRFLASPCGTYLTAAADIKNNNGENFVICDGGINHLKYYGQTMAMQTPPITLLGDHGEKTEDYTLCGSLCTTADILVRKVTLPALSVGDVLAFGRCGAYSVTEGIGLFLSRQLPRIVLHSERGGNRLLRDFYGTDILNSPAEV